MDFIPNGAGKSGREKSRKSFTAYHALSFSTVCSDRITFIQIVTCPVFFFVLLFFTCLKSNLPMVFYADDHEMELNLAFGSPFGDGFSIDSYFASTVLHSEQSTGEVKDNLLALNYDISLSPATKRNCTFSRNNGHLGSTSGLLVQVIGFGDGVTQSSKAYRPSMAEAIVRAKIKQWYTKKGVTLLSRKSIVSLCSSKKKVVTTTTYPKGGVLFTKQGFGVCGPIEETLPVYILAIRHPLLRFLERISTIAQALSKIPNPPSNVKAILPGFIKKTKYASKPSPSLVKLLISFLKIAFDENEDVDSLYSHELRSLLNSQTEELCGYDCLIVSSKSKKKAVAYSSKLSEKEKLDRALEHLDSIHVIVVLENVNQSFSQFQWNLDWVPSGMTDFSLQSSQDKYDVEPILDILVTDEEAAVLKKWMWMEMVLYRKAVELSEQRSDLATRCLKP